MGRGHFAQKLLQSKRRPKPETGPGSADLRARARDFRPGELKNVCNIYSSRKNVKKAADRAEKCVQYLLQSERSEKSSRSS